MGIDNVSCLSSFEKIMKANTMNEAMEIIKKEFKHNTLVILYLLKQLENNMKNLENNIHQIIVSVYPEAPNNNITDISQYILKISNSSMEQDIT